MRNLLDFLQKYHHWLIFILLEVVSGVLLFKYNSYQNSVFFSSANAVIGKIYQWENNVFSFFNYGRMNEELTLRNFYLERQVDQLRRLVPTVWSPIWEWLVAMVSWVLSIW